MARNRTVSTTPTTAIPAPATLLAFSTEHLWIMGIDVPVMENGAMREVSVMSQRNPNIILHLVFRRNTASALMMNNKMFIGTEREPSQVIA